jgi:hypothetical protein
VPDTRNHRGAHPEDERDFANVAHARLRAATRELSFLFEHAYAPESALKLVGERHQLTARQRQAVLRAACAESAASGRAARRISAAQLAGRALALDGFNCLISVEAMLAAAPLFRGRDGALRDLASVHGSYRAVLETQRAAGLLVSALTRHRVATAQIVLDRPVGNSGRTRVLFLQLAAQLSWPLEVKLSDRVDQELAAHHDVVASSDSWILDRAPAWADLPAIVAQDEALAPWVVDLASESVGASDAT